MALEQFSTEFEKARPHLKSYLLRITASVEDSEDIVQDTFIKASVKLDTFRAESTVKTWIFTIASNIAKDNLRAKKRWPEAVTDICREKALANPNYFPEIANIILTSPQATFEIKEHISFCLTCISKSLPLEQQICILLKEIYDFRVAEIVDILQTSEAMVKYYLQIGRSKMVNIYEGRCALINKEGTCHQCSELNGIFFDPATGDSPPELSSVTVLAPSAMLADALTKVMFVAGPQHIARLARQWQVGVRWVDKTGRWQATADVRLT